jgi:hypothetical protein
MNQKSFERKEVVFGHQEVGEARLERIDGNGGEAIGEGWEAKNGNSSNGSGSAGDGLERQGHAPARVEIPTVEPWPEPVNGAELLDAIRKELARFVVFPKWGAEVFALWIMHMGSSRGRYG